MDPRFPRLTFGLRTVVTVLIILVLANAFIGHYPGHPGEKIRIFSIFTGDEIWALTGWSLQEWLFFGFATLLFMTSIWTGKERPLLSVESVSSEAKYESMELQQTSIGTSSSSQASPQTAAIVASIVGSEQKQNEDLVNSALDNLSKIDVGEVIAAPQVRMAVQEAGTSDANLEKPSLDLPDLPLTESVSSERDFVSSGGVASVPLPSSEPLELPELPTLPDLPDLEDIFEEKSVDIVPPLDLPELPEID